MTTTYYTLIGSRKTPVDKLELLVMIGRCLSNKGYTVRSGGANGADSAAETSHLGLGGNGKAEIYLPWDNFNDHHAGGCYINTPNQPTYSYAVEIAKAVHPAWNKCSRGAKALHTRNVYQVLGLDLNTPSEFVVCYADVDKHNNVIGGTATAVNIAIDAGIPVYNISIKEQLEALVDIL